MQIMQKRIRNLDRHLPGIAPGRRLVLAVPTDAVPPERLHRIGFSSPPQGGEQILPPALGPISRANAEGWIIRHTDRPKETCYRQAEWHYNEWHGNTKVPVSKIVDIPYERYQRTHLPPPGIELLVIPLPSGQLAVAIPPTIELSKGDPKKLLHCINLMLELFGVCHVFGPELIPVGGIPVTSLNWRVLPSGAMPWPKLRPHLKRVIENQKQGAQPVIEHRLAAINSHKPTFAAVGHGGFTGYVIFGFPEKNLYVLECTRYGNATYVLESQWEALSKLTKAEILNQDLHKARLIHQAKWEGKVRKLLQG